MSTVPTPPFTTWWDLVSRTDTEPAASGVVVLEAGLLDCADSDAAGCDDCDAEVVTAAAVAEDVTAGDGDTGATDFGEPLSHATTRVAVSATART